MSDPVAKSNPKVRRKLFLNSKMQNVLIRYGICMAVVFLSLGMFLAYCFDRILSAQMHEAQWFGSREIILLALLIAINIGTCYLALVVSNRIIGPIFKLIRNMEDFERTGKLNEIYFRKSDFFQEISTSYNKIVIRFKELDSKK